MRVATLRALEERDTNRNRQIERSELRSIDTNKDGTFSATEMQEAGLDVADRAELNARYKKGNMQTATAILFSRTEMSGFKVAAPLNTYFNSIDRDNNQLLSKSELGRALGRTDLDVKSAAAVTAAYKHHGTMSALSDDTGWLPRLPQNEYLDKLPLHHYDERGISKNDLKAFVQQQGKAEVSEVMGRYSMSSYPRLQESNDLFANGKASIRPDHITQGELGDCYFLAAVASLANTERGKTAIFDMIKPLEGNRFEVTFPGQSPVTVDAPTHSERSLYSSSGKDGIWLAVLEKAYAHQQNDSAWIIKHSNPYDKIGNGALLDAGIRAVSGKFSDTDILPLTRMSTLRLKLQQAVAGEKSATAGILNELWGDKRTDNGLPVGHAYSILDYNAATDEVTVRNPWGSTELVDDKGRTRDGKNDGTFTMSLTEFKSTFHMIAYEK